MKYGQLIDPENFLGKDLLVWQKPKIDSLFRSLQTTEILSFQLEHLNNMPRFDFWIWVVIEGLATEKRDRAIWLIKGFIHSSVPKLHEFHQFNFEGRLDYSSVESPSSIKIIE